MTGISRSIKQSSNSGEKMSSRRAGHLTSFIMQLPSINSSSRLRRHKSHFNIDGFSLSATSVLLLQFVLYVQVRHTCCQGRDKWYFCHFNLVPNVPYTHTHSLRTSVGQVLRLVTICPLY